MSRHVQASLEERNIEPELVRLLYGSRLPSIAALALGFGTCVALWSYLPHLMVLGWGTMLVVAHGLRMWMRHVFSRDREDPLLASAWLRRYTGTSLLIGVTLAGLAYWSAAALPIHGALLPAPALGMPLSLVLIGFFFMITRQNVISQIVGLLTLENGVFLATVAIAPGLPFAIGFLLLLDLLPAVVFYGVFARLIAARAKTTSIEDMAVLRG